MSRRKNNHETGYKKRLARRNSGRPGINQMWVPAYYTTKDGARIPHPLAASKKDAQAAIAEAEKEAEKEADAAHL